MRYAVIPTHNRPTDLRECLHALHGQVDYAIVIDNASEPPIRHLDFDGRAGLPPTVIIRDSEQPPNLSRLWNLGILMAEELEGFDGSEAVSEDGFWIAIVNDDAIVPPGWMDLMVHWLEFHGGSAACTDPFRQSGQVRKYGNGSGTVLGESITSVYERMCGWAFVLDGQDAIRADERLRWWYGDTAIDLEARSACGMLMIPGPPVINKYPNSSTTGELAAQAGLDRAVFEKNYGRVPW